MATLATDNFNRTNAASLGANWTASTASAGNDDGDFSIASNQCIADSAIPGVYYSGVAFPDDQWAQATAVTLAETWTAVRVRNSSSAATYYSGGSGSGAFGNNNHRIWKTVTGTRTSLGSQAVNLADGDVLYLEAQGTNVVLKVNGATAVSLSGESSIASGSAGLGGRTSSSSKPVFDDFTAGDFDAGGGGVSTTVGAVSAAATATAIGGATAHVVGNSAGVASVAGVGANAASGTTQGASAGQAAAAGVAAAVAHTIGNSAGQAAGAAVGDAVRAGETVGVAAGIATVSGVASAIVSAVGTSSGASSADGINDQIVINQIGVSVGAGGEEDYESWQDYVRKLQARQSLQTQLKKQKTELKKVAKKLKVAVKQVVEKRTEGVLANILDLELKKDEIENKIEAIQYDLKPLQMMLAKAHEQEIQEDDEEFFAIIR
jgi:hypothetical protein